MNNIASNKFSLLCTLASLISTRTLLGAATRYPNCRARDPFRVGDGRCDTDKDIYNNDCGWDEGDCISPEYPKCVGSPDTSKTPMEALGDGRCDIEFNTRDCGFDGDDCIELNEKGYPNCDTVNSSIVGNGKCESKWINTEECGWDGGDCLEFNSKYPKCKVNDPSKINDGTCDAGHHGGYFTEECGFDGGDCEELQLRLESYPNCQSTIPYYLLGELGDGNCNNKSLNTEECGFDLGDCNDFNTKYPECDAYFISFIGDKQCKVEYNTEECGYDGGDCIEFNDKNLTNCSVKLPHMLGNGKCDGGKYNTKECGWDDDDCKDFNEKYPDCSASEHDIGNGVCFQEYNIIECAYDGGDCNEENKNLKKIQDKYKDLYKNCTFFPIDFADGFCNIYSVTFNDDCGWDGGDCLVEGYPNCHVDEPNRIGDGFCDECTHLFVSKQSRFNSKECGYDGGDCIAFNQYFNNTYPDCHVANPHEVGNGRCERLVPEYDTDECGYDGGDCYLNDVCGDDDGDCETNNGEESYGTPIIDSNTFIVSTLPAFVFAFFGFIIVLNIS